MATEATQVVPYVDLRRGIGTDALSNSALAGLLLDSVEAVSVIAGVPLVDREEWASLSFRRSSPAGILRVPGVLRDIKRVRYVKLGATAVTNDSVSNFDVGTVLTPRQGENRIMPASLGLAGGWPLIEPGSSIEVQLVHGVDSEEDGSGVPRNLKRAVILVAERLHAGDSVDGVKDQLEELTRDWMSGNTVVVVPPEPDVTTLYADAHDIRFMSATDQAFIESSRTSSTTNRITPPDIVVPPGENGQYVSFFYPSARGVLASAILAGFESIASLEDMGQVVVDGETGHHWQSRTVFFPSLNGFAWTLT